MHAIIRVNGRYVVAHISNTKVIVGMSEAARKATGCSQLYVSGTSVDRVHKAVTSCNARRFRTVKAARECFAPFAVLERRADMDVE